MSTHTRPPWAARPGRVSVEPVQASDVDATTGTATGCSREHRTVTIPPILLRFRQRSACCRWPEPAIPDRQPPANRLSTRGGSRQFHRPVIITMAIVRVMQAAIHKVIDVVTMGHGFVSAIRPMRMCAPRLGRAV